MPARTFRSLRASRNYRLWFIGQVVSLTGTWVQNVAQAWFIVALTHSPLALGLLVACQFAPYALFGLVGGAVTDRLNIRHTLMATQIALMIAAVALATLTLTGVAQAWHVYVIAGFGGLVQVLDLPARQAFTMELVGRRELPNAVGLNSSMFNASRVVGPALGGLVIAAAGVGVCFVINALSFLAVLAALAAMNPAGLHAPGRTQMHRSLLRATGEGLAYAWRTPTIRLIIAMMLVTGTVSMNFNVLLPVLTEKTLNAGPVTFGWLSAAFGAGALVGALVAATMGRASRGLLLAGAAAFGGSQLLLAPLHDDRLCALLLFATGVSFSLYTAMSNSTIQMIVPDRLRGRVMAIYGYVFFGTAPLGGLLTGVLAATGGTALAFGVAGVTAVVVAAFGALAHIVNRRTQAYSGATLTATDSTLARQ